MRLLYTRKIEWSWIYQPLHKLTTNLLPRISSPNFGPLWLLQTTPGICPKPFRIWGSYISWSSQLSHQCSTCRLEQEAMVHWAKWTGASDLPWNGASSMSNSGTSWMTYSNLAKRWSSEQACAVETDYLWNMTLFNPSQQERAKWCNQCEFLNWSVIFERTQISNLQISSGDQSKRARLEFNGEKWTWNLRAKGSNWRPLTMTTDPWVQQPPSKKPHVWFHTFRLKKNAAMFKYLS